VCTIRTSACASTDSGMRVRFDQITLVAFMLCSLDTHSMATLRPLAVSLVVLALVACGSQDDGDVLKGGRSSVLVGPKMGSYGGTGGGGSVAMAGRCLGFEGATVLWPHGTKIVTDDPLTIEVPGLGRITSGDSVYGGVDTFAPGHLPDGISAIPDGCPTTLIAFFPDG
jgi:hypothetical protein